MATISPAVKVNNKPAPPPKPKGASQVATGVSPRGTATTQQGNGATTLSTPVVGGGSSLSDNWRKSPSSSASESTSCSSTARAQKAVVASKSSPKPALLPKPQLTPPSSAKQVSILKATPPDVVLSTEHTRVLTNNDAQQVATKESPPSCASKIRSSPVRAPVAKLEEFENSPKPVRPPRSPKIKQFPQGPFDTSNEKPAIPVKKKSLLALQNARAEAANSKLQVKLQFPVAAERKSRAGCSGATPFATKFKSASLGRNIEPPLLDSPQSLDLESQYWDIATVLKSSTTPVRPPRKGRKKFDSNSDLLAGHALCRSISLFNSIEEAERNIPIYAEVNYNLKKNRRQAAQSSSVLETKKGTQITFNFNIESSTSDDNFFKKSNNFSTINEPVECNNNANSNIVVANKPSNNWIPPTKVYHSLSESENHLIGVKSSKVEESVNIVKPDVGVFIKQDSVSDRDKNYLDYVMGNSECSGPLPSQSCAPKQSAQSNVKIDKEEEKVSVQHEVVDENVHVPDDSATKEKLEDKVAVTRASETEIKSVVEISVESNDIANINAISVETIEKVEIVNIIDQSTSIDIQNVSVGIIDKSSLEKTNIKVSTKSSAASQTEFETCKVAVGQIPMSCDVIEEVVQNIDESFHEKLSDKWSSAEAIEDSIASSRLEYMSAKASIHSSLNDVQDALEEVYEATVTESSIVKAQTSEADKNMSVIFDGVDKSIENAICFLGSREATISKSSQEIHDLTNEAKDEIKKLNGNAANVITDIMPHEKERAKSMPHLGGVKHNSSERHFLTGAFTRRHRGNKGTSPWCDEGELSTGVLGDLDSSDAARQSSVDDVGVSDNEDTTPVRRNKLSSITQFTKNIIRKSTRKSKESKKDTTQSHFYCNKPSNSSEADDAEENTSSSVKVVENMSMMSLTQCEEDDQGACSLETINSRTENSSSIVSHSDSENDGDNGVADSGDPHLTKEQKQAKKAYQTAEEIMTSERDFVYVLKLLCVDFRSFVNASSKDSKNPVIPECDVIKILQHLPEILEFSQLLLHDLEQRILQWSSTQKISDVIVKKGPFLKLYTSYMQNYLQQCKFLEECCKKYPLFAKVVQDFQASPRCKKLKLEHCMLKPVQRVPQYRLLLEQYLKCLQPDSPDLTDTKTALHIVCEVADHANRTLAEGDVLSKLLKLQALLGHYELIKPGRSLIREGELLKLCRKGMQPRYFILLNDCLLYTTYCGSGLSSGLKVNYEIPIHQMKVNVPSAEDYRNEFSIINRTRSFTLAASSPEEMQHWVDDLHAAIEEKATKQSTFLHQKTLPFQNDSSTFKLGREAPIWIPDDRVTMCQICFAEFTVTFRRHHCRACGKVVCGDCSANKAPLPYMNFQPARICNQCYNILLKEFEDPEFTLAEDLSNEAKNELLESAKSHFKKATPVVNKKVKKYIPQRLKEVCANDGGCQISGWLQRFQRRSWKKMWFVLKEQVLYVYKASEDVVALESIPVLGYEVEFAQKHFQLYEGIDAKLVFMLTHKGQPQLVFHAENYQSAHRWIQAMQQQTVLPA